MTLDLVSVIIPLCNKGAYIEETIESVKAQSWRKIEIIIIENNSTDNSYEIAKKYECSNLRVIQSKKKGASAARNLGLKLAKGKFIQFLDADDLLSPSKIESQVTALTNDSDLAISNWARFKNNLLIEGNIKREIPENRLVIYKPTDYLETRHMSPVHSWLCPASLIKRVGRWNENITVNDDGEYLIRIIKECRQIIYVPEVAYYRSDTTFSLSQNQERRGYESLYSTYSTFKDLVAEYNSPKLNDIANEKFGYLFLKTYNTHKRTAHLCEQQLNFNYEYCYPSLSKFSRLITVVLGIKLYLKLKKLQTHILSFIS